MPLIKRLVEPSSLCQHQIPDGVVDELECVINNSLSGVILQLSSLSVHAEDMFGELFNEANAFYSRANNLQGRIDKLSEKVTRLDSTVEEVSLHDINMRKAFRSSMKTDQQVVSRETLLNTLKAIYMSADKPPPLQNLNRFRDDGRDALKIYTDPDYFFNLWRDAMQKEMRDAKERRRGQRKRERKLNPTHRERKVKAAVPFTKIRAAQIKQGVEFVDAPSISRTRTPEQFQVRKPPVLSRTPSDLSTSTGYSTASPPMIPKYNEVITDNSIQSCSPTLSKRPPPPPKYHDPPPQYTDLPEPPPPPQEFTELPRYPAPISLPPPPSPPRAISPIPPTPPIPSHFAGIPQSLSPIPTGVAPDTILPPAPPPPQEDLLALPPPPPPPPISEPESPDTPPANQSEFAKSLANVRLTKVQDRERPPPVADSRSELLQAIRLGQDLKKVEQQEKTSSNFLEGNDVASILARRIAILLTDSESESYDDDDDDSDWD